MMDLSDRTERVLSRASLLFLAFVMTCALAPSVAFATDHTEDSTYARSSGREAGWSEDEWEYDTYYIFPLTRHMSESGLPMAGQIVLYPFAFMIDLGQWPFGALAGLAGK